MPGYDGTGPAGRGLNGRGLGPCGAGGMRQPNRRLFGFGRRGGRGGFWRNLAGSADIPNTVSNEKQWLERQREIIDSRLKSLDEE